MAEVRKEAKAALAKAADDMAKFYDRGRGEAPAFKVGNKVWLDGRDIKTDCPTKKLDHR